MPKNTQGPHSAKLESIVNSATTVETLMSTPSYVGYQGDSRRGRTSTASGNTSDRTINLQSHAPSAVRLFDQQTAGKGDGKSAGQSDTASPKEVD